MSWRTKIKLIRKQEAQEGEFSVTSFRKPSHHLNPLIMHSTVLRRRNCRAICMTHRETILHRPAHIWGRVLQADQGKAFLLAICTTISWIFRVWRGCDGENENDNDFAARQLKYEFVKIWSKVVKMTLSCILFKQLLKHLHCGFWGGRGETYTCSDFRVFFICKGNMIFLNARVIKKKTAQWSDIIEQQRATHALQRRCNFGLECLAIAHMPTTTASADLKYMLKLLLKITRQKSRCSQKHTVKGHLNGCFSRKWLWH